MSEHSRFLPAAILGVGCLLLLRVTGQHVMPLAQPLSSLPDSIQGYHGTDLSISPDEQAVAGMTSYVFRRFGPDSSIVFSVYVGYYDYQAQGKTVHSPKNCLPGAGWEPLRPRRSRLLPPAGPFPSTSTSWPTRISARS